MSVFCIFWKVSHIPSILFFIIDALNIVFSSDLSHFWFSQVDKELPKPDFEHLKRNYDLFNSVSPFDSIMILHVRQ